MACLLVAFILFLFTSCRSSFFYFFFSDMATSDTKLALKRVLRSARHADGISRGLHESAKALDK